ncbi:MAG TPA: serine protease [Anaeromyxobacter sp.]
MPRAGRALLASVLLAPLATRPVQGVPARPPCTGRYADTLSAMVPAARERESRPVADWVYCLRASAVYERVSYGRGGKLVHEYTTKVRHGTGFAYRQRDGEWLVATNQHVVAFPEVTADGQELEGVPAGSRRVRSEVRIVSNESEPDAPEHILLRPLLVDDALDIAVLATREPLRTIPYRLGRSADLRVGNAVLVRGYPLGAFAASNAGRVIGLGQHDLERAWDHEDFVVDALLNLGSSGSPVLAVACDTGEPEVVGVYHAGYRNAQGLNVVIALDQLRSALDELRVPQRNASAREPAADPAETRAALARGPVLFPFGGRAVRAERQGDGVRFAVLDEGFPLSARVELSIVDRGLAAEGQAADLRSALWEQLALVLRYRAVEAGAEARRSPTARDRIAARVRRGEPEQEQLLAAVKAGAEGLTPVTRGERDPASRGRSDAADRAGRGVVEVILGAH